LFLKKFCRDAKKPAMKISGPAMKKLTSHRWPGNVRELQNVIERAVVLKSGDTIEADDLVLQPMDLSEEVSDGQDLPFHDSVDFHKKQIIRHALTQAGGSQTHAAKLLGLQRTYLARLIKQMEIR
jgi:DNA-binding NtrC family response regulator